MVESRHQNFDICLEDETQVWTPICRNLLNSSLNQCFCPLPIDEIEIWHLKVQVGSFRLSGVRLLDRNCTFLSNLRDFPGTYDFISGLEKQGVPVQWKSMVQKSRERRRFYDSLRAEFDAAALLIVSDSDSD